MGDVQTVADSKRRFYAGYRRVIPGLFRRVVDELLVELHLLRRQQGFGPMPSLPPASARSLTTSPAALSRLTSGRCC